MALRRGMKLLPPVAQERECQKMDLVGKKNPVALLIFGWCLSLAKPNHQTRGQGACGCGHRKEDEEEKSGLSPPQLLSWQFSTALQTSLSKAVYALLCD